jgi:hypothetical protein
MIDFVRTIGGIAELGGQAASQQRHIRASGGKVVIGGWSMKRAFNRGSKWKG